MHVFCVCFNTSVICGKFADKELSQKCDILLFGFVFAELLYLFCFVKLHIIR